MPADQTIELNEKDERQPQPQPATELAITGMTCGNCARHVTEAIQGVPGVRSATVNLETQQASVRWAAGAEQNVRAVMQAVAAAGYEARLVEAHVHDHGEHKLAAWQLNLWLGVLGTAPLVLG